MAYKGLEKVDILDRKILRNDLITNIRETMLFLERHLNKGAVIKGIRRQDELEIPETALREAVVNSVMHRDYFEEGAQTTIEVFKNRVEISSPGGLPAGLSETEFGKKSLTRNPVIAEILLRTSFIEKLGTGINRIRREVKSALLPPPEFVFNTFFTITFKRSSWEPITATEAPSIKPSYSAPYDNKKGQTALNDTINDTISDTINDTINDIIKTRLVKIIKLLLREPGLKSNELADRCKVKQVTIKRDLQKLRFLIEYRGSKKSGGYYISDQLMEKLKNV